MFRLLLIPLLLALLLFSKTTYADQTTFSQGDPLAVWHAKHPKMQVQNLQALKEKAEQGDVSKQMELGSRYHDGNGVDVDPDEALKWWRKAADNGNALAMEEIGHLYLMPFHSGRKALKWFSLAAKHGRRTASVQIALMYLNGLSVKQDYAKSMHWLQSAADQGSPNAMEIIAFAYLDGWHGYLKKDSAESIKWFRKSAEMKFQQSQLELGDLYAKGDAVKQDWQEALFWYSLAAETLAPLYQHQIDDAESHLNPDQIMAVRKRVAEWETTHVTTTLQ